MTHTLKLQQSCRKPITEKCHMLQFDVFLFFFALKLHEVVMKWNMSNIGHNDQELEIRGQKNIPCPKGQRDQHENECATFSPSIYSLHVHNIF
jgi:hypothetical protein